MKIILLYVTHKNQEEAEKISNHLLEKRLIACTNFFPIKSSYWWKGGIETTDEIVTLFKTKEENYDVVTEAILAMHPYETPCILKLEADANESYATWIREEASN